jgi:hypothetical protein
MVGDSSCGLAGGYSDTKLTQHGTRTKSATEHSNGDCFPNLLLQASLHLTFVPSQPLFLTFTLPLEGGHLKDQYSLLSLGHLESSPDLPSPYTPTISPIFSLSLCPQDAAATSSKTLVMICQTT